MATARGIGYVPALDGLRAVAVVAVILFHSEMGWAAGGFLGVSLFFTLSGFLITSLLLAEFRATGRIALGAFYARRARRLLPAAWLSIGLVIAGSGWFWNDVQLARLRGDVWAAVASVANWRFAAADTSYQDLFEQSPSPLAHFWSLAIEEQFYLVFPVVVLLTLRWAGRRGLAIVTGMLLALSAAAAARTASFDIAYNGTHTRAAELLAGVLLALTVSAAPVVRFIGDTPMRRALQCCSLVACAAFVWSVVSLDLADAWLGRGGFVGFSVVSAVLVAGAAHRGPLATALSWSPLVAIGKVSYGMYLFHWPLFLVLSPERLGLDGLELLGVRSIALAVISAASYLLIEQPLRRGEFQTRRPIAWLAPTACVGVLVAGTLATTTPTKASTTNEILARATGDAIGFTATPSTPAGTPSHAAADEEPGRSDSEAPTVTVLVVGSDPHAVDVLRSVEHEGLVVVDGVQRGCPAAPGIAAKLRSGAIVELSRCEPTATRLRRLVTQHQPAFVVLSLGELDDSILRQRVDDGFPADDDHAEVGARRARAERVISSGVAGLVERDIGVAIAWWGPDGVTRRALDRIAIAEQHLPAVVTTDLGLRNVLAPVLDPEVDPAAAGASTVLRRVLVFGDSTSLFFATALHEADAGFDILWAGDNGCPVVRAVAIRTSPSAERKPLDCPPFDEKLPPLLESFDPEIAVLVAGPVELVEQYYPGDPAPHAPGSQRYAAFHDEELSSLAELFARHDVAVLAADAPTIRPGPFASESMTDTVRLDAWNDALRRIDERHAHVSILDYAEPLLAYEAEHGSIRPDGTHPEIEPLTELLKAAVIGQI